MPRSRLDARLYGASGRKGVTRSLGRQRPSPDVDSPHLRQRLAQPAMLLARTGQATNGCRSPDAAAPSGRQRTAFWPFRFCDPRIKGPPVNPKARAGKLHPSTGIQVRALQVFRQIGSLCIGIMDMKYSHGAREPHGASNGCRVFPRGGPAGGLKGYLTSSLAFWSDKAKLGILRWCSPLETGFPIEAG